METQFLLFVFAVGLVSPSSSPECDQTLHVGWMVDYSRRECRQMEAVVCDNPFHYNSREECEADFHGNLNVCDSYPCLNGGLCLQTVRTNNHERHRGYRCDCLGTGHYGNNCENSCRHDRPHHPVDRRTCLVF